MRIFLSCQQARRAHPVPAYSFWEYYFVEALKEAGHEIVQAPEVDWAEGLNPLTPAERRSWKDRTWGRTVDFLRLEHRRRPVDFFLGYLFPDQVEPAALGEIHALGIPTVNFFCDNVREFSRVPKEYAAFDLHWVPETEAQKLYRQAALPFLYAPMAVWIPPALRSLPSLEQPGAVFIGSRDPLREDLLGRASELGLPLKIFGAGWHGEADGGAPPAGRAPSILANQTEFLRRHGLWGLLMKSTYTFHPRRFSAWMPGQPPIGSERYFEETRTNAIAVGINRCPSFRRSFGHPVRYSRLRDIEAPMLGACYLTEAAPGIEDLYEIGTEIETYRDAAELVEKANGLLRDEGRRLRLRQNGQHRALSQHTIARTIEKISARLGL